MYIPTGDQAYTNFNVIQRLLITTKGWGVQVKCRGQSTNWVPLNLNKESNTIEVGKHAMYNSYSYEPAFRWCVHIMLKKHNRILNKVKSRCQNNRFKFGGRISPNI